MAPLPREIWEDLIGLPYGEFSRGPYAYDCYGLCMEVYKRRGIIIPDIRSEFSVKALIETFKTEIYRWEPSPVEAGALLTFGKNRLAIHCGIAIDENKFIHASEKFGSVLVARLQGSSILYHNDLIGSYSYVG